MFLKFCCLVWALLIIPIMVFAQVDTMHACQNCGCALDYSPSGIMISHVHDKGKWMMSYRYSRQNMDGIYIGSNTVSHDYVFQKYLMSPERMNMDMHMVMAMYGISNSITAMGMFHYHSMSMDMNMLEGTTHMHGGSVHGNHAMKSSGIGDAKIQFLYRFLNRTKHQLLVAGGFNLPLGSIQVKGDTESMYEGSRLPYGMQLGSGTWDILPVLNYSYQIGRQSVWNTQVSSVVRSGYTKVGYKLGNEYLFTSWVALGWLKNRISNTLRIEAQSIGSIKGEDPTLFWSMEPSANPFAYGGTRVSGYLGVNLHFLKTSKLSLEYGMPVYQNLLGPQLGAKSSIMTSLNLMF